MNSPFSQQVRHELRAYGAREAYRRLIAQNDARLLGSELDGGREIAAERTAIHTVMVEAWAEGQVARLKYEKPFAVVALGGTGRGEMTPCSDTDFAFLFDDELEGNSFLEELQRQIQDGADFEQCHGFTCGAFPFNFDDVVGLEGKQLNAFLDMRTVYDPLGLAPRLLKRIRETYDPFEHFLHVTKAWREEGAAAAAACERLDSFEIKQDGLRVFLAGVWALAGKEFRHSLEIYESLEDKRDLDAYGFLLRIRGFVHARRGTRTPPSALGAHAEDALGFDDFISFGELLGERATERERFEFANAVRARLLSARRRVARFTRGVVGRELQRGREIARGNPIFFGSGGLRHVWTDDEKGESEKSRAAFSLLLASQRYGVPIDPAELDRTFGNAGDWLVPVPELSALFSEPRGSLAASFAFLSRFDGAEDRLFPGYARFEASLDERVMAERKVIRGALERQKMGALEEMVQRGRARLDRESGRQLNDLNSPIDGKIDKDVEAALLDVEHLSAVKLALKTKRLPETEFDRKLRADESLPLHERFSTGFSEIPLATYYTRSLDGAAFPPETLELAGFLVAHRREFKLRADDGINDKGQVDGLVRLCRTEAILRALYIFTCADRAEWDSVRHDGTRWFNTDELYELAIREFRPDRDPSLVLLRLGYTPEEYAILKDFGTSLLTGAYRLHTGRFGQHLVGLADGSGPDRPKASVIVEGGSAILAVAARDYRGLAASMSGAFLNHGIMLRQAHLFSAVNHRLALNFFHLAPGGQRIGPELLRKIEDAIAAHEYTRPEDEAHLEPATGRVKLSAIRPKLYRLRSSTSGEVGALVYALTYRIYRHLRGNVFGLRAHSGRGHSFVSVYLELPPGMSLSEAESIVAEMF